MGRCHHRARCYVQLLPSGPNHSSNGHFTKPVAIVIFIATKGHSSDGTILKFSPTSPTRTHAHRLLNTWQSKVFKDHKHSCTGPQGGRWYTYMRVRMCANGHVVYWRKEHPMENVLLSIFFMQNKRN
jgi:hypothetical protein